MKDTSRKVTLLCPLCGNSLFEVEEHDDCSLIDAPDDIQVHCSDCGTVYTKRELIDRNAEVIENVVQEIKCDILREFDKELRRRFKKWK